MYFSQVLNPCLWGLHGAVFKLCEGKMEILLGLPVCFVVVFNPIICDFYIDLLLMSRAYLAI